MDKVKAITKYVRISPRKVRPTANLVRGLSAEKAVLQLTHARNKAGRLLVKTLHSAIANAEMELDASKEDLYVSEIFIDEGPRWKRSKPKNRGGRHPFKKRTSHFTVVLEIG